MTGSSLGPSVVSAFGLPRHAILASTLLAVLGGQAGAADTVPPPGSLEELKQQIAEQTRRLDELKRQMATEEAKLRAVQRALGMETLAQTRGGQAASAQSQYQSAAPAPTPGGPVGQAPANRDKAPQVAQIFEQPGVLTPRGKYTLEPSLQYSYSSNNRVALVGYTVIPALTIGLIDVREVKRNTVTAALTGRWGLTNRAEIEAKVPWVYRSDDSITRQLATPTATDAVFNATGKGIGDVEFTGRYQLNDGGAEKPYYIGTLRFKTRTGKDPFSIPTLNIPGCQGPCPVQSELPTGSGFYTLQPGLTFLLPSDPAVFFGSVSYQYNFKRTDVDIPTIVGSGANQSIVSQRVDSIQAGGAFGFNFGMGLALNERSSFSLGYDHLSVGRNKINGSADPLSVRVQLATLLLGYSYRLTPTSFFNVSVGAGLTRDTPDLQLTVRIPMTF